MKLLKIRRFGKHIILHFKKYNTTNEFVKYFAKLNYFSQKLLVFANFSIVKTKYHILDFFRLKMNRKTLLRTKNETKIAFFAEKEAVTRNSKCITAIDS